MSIKTIIIVNVLNSPYVASSGIIQTPYSIRALLFIFCIGLDGDMTIMEIQKRRTMVLKCVTRTLLTYTAWVISIVSSVGLLTLSTMLPGHFNRYQSE